MKRIFEASLLALPLLLLSGSWGAPLAQAQSPFDRQISSRYTLGFPLLLDGPKAHPGGTSKGDFWGPATLAGRWMFEPNFEHVNGYGISLDLGFLPGRNAYPFVDLRVHYKNKTSERFTLRAELGLITKDVFTSGAFRVDDQIAFPPTPNQWVATVGGDYDFDWHSIHVDFSRFDWFDAAISNYEGHETVVGGSANYKLGVSVETKREIEKWGWEFGLDTFFLGTVLIASKDFGEPVSARTAMKLSGALKRAMNERLDLVARYSFVGLLGDTDRTSLPFQAPYYNRDYLLATHALRVEATWNF